MKRSSTSSKSVVYHLVLRRLHERRGFILRQLSEYMFSATSKPGRYHECLANLLGCNIVRVKGVVWPHSGADAQWKWPRAEGMPVADHVLSGTLEQRVQSMATRPDYLPHLPPLSVSVTLSARPIDTQLCCVHAAPAVRW
jgi:hypothetical protein